MYEKKRRYYQRGARRVETRGVEAYQADRVTDYYEFLLELMRMKLAKNS